MKKIVLLLSCVLLSTQLIVAEHSQAACEECGQQLKDVFDPEWNRWNEGYCSSCGKYNHRCQEDSSEFVNPFDYR